MIDYTLPLDELPDPLPIVPLERPFDVTITPPGSKSITNRAYVLAALADGESRIIRPLRSDDTDGLLKALCMLGAQARWDGEDVFIKGVNGRFSRGGSVNLGDGGTPTRFMIAAACLAAEPVVVDGSKRMRERPIAEGVDMLRKLGATIEYVEEEGRLPVRIGPSASFKGGELTVGKTASSQFISAVMLIGPWLERGADICFVDRVTSWPYIALTQSVMYEWEIGVENNLDFDERREGDPTWGALRGSLRIAPQHVHGSSMVVEPDASSAVYWLFAAATTPGSVIRIPHLALESSQPDVGLLPIFYYSGSTEVQSEIDGVRLVGGDRFKAQSFAGDRIPDGVLAYAGAAALADGTSTITGLHTLRVKETDRIAALANELRKVGCAVETTDDSITITPPRDAAKRAATVRERTDRGESTLPHGRGGSLSTPLPYGRGSYSPVTIETYNDHRMAMSFAVLGLVRPGISIANPKCVAKSYPTFWRDFAKLYANPASATGAAGIGE